LSNHYWCALSQSGEPNRIRSVFKTDAARQQIDIEAAFGSLLTAQDDDRHAMTEAGGLFSTSPLSGADLKK
jgi:hypothetical protein